MKYEIVSADFDKEIGDDIIDVRGPEGNTVCTFFGPHSSELAKLFITTITTSEDNNDITHHCCGQYSR